MPRIPVIAGNWKMNTTPSEGLALALELKPLLSDVEGVEIIVAPPFTHLQSIGEALKGTPLKLASQNVYSKDSGAYTGEISPPMIRELGCEYAIIGHSERRHSFGETDEAVNAKVLATLGNGMTPIICVGETLEEREAEKTLDVIGMQTDGALKGLSKDQCADIIMAYEPVWAIGTGKTASNDQAQEVHSFIRKRLAELFDAEPAQKVRILYGGSVKPENVDGLMSEPDIDGALVGGASLKAGSFEKIVKFRRG